MTGPTTRKWVCCKCETYRWCEDFGGRSARDLDRGSVCDFCKLEETLYRTVTSLMSKVESLTAEKESMQQEMAALKREVESLRSLSSKVATDPGRALPSSAPYCDVPEPPVKQKKKKEKKKKKRSEVNSCATENSSGKEGETKEMKSEENANGEEGKRKEMKVEENASGEERKKRKIETEEKEKKTEDKKERKEKKIY